MPDASSSAPASIVNGAAAPVARPCQWIAAEIDPRAFRQAHGSLDGIHCGAPALPGKSYCAEHQALAYDRVRTDEAGAGFQLRDRSWLAHAAARRRHAGISARKLAETFQ